jgi:hypothetical protein
VSEFFLGGMLKTYKLRDLITGWESDFSEKLNIEGTELEGNLFVTNKVTPLMIDWLGPSVDRKFTILTGEEDPSLAGTMVKIDEDGAYIWQIHELWTG